MKSKSYLFQRPGSSNWYYRFVYPKDLADRLIYGPNHPKAGRTIIAHKVSLGTSNLDEARIKMLDLLRTDLNMVTVFRGPIRRGPEKWAQEPGTIVDHPDGTFSVATETHIDVFGPDRKLVRRGSNYKDQESYYERITDELSIELSDGRTVTTRRPSPAKRDVGKDVLDLWAKVKAVKSAIRREADRAYETFKEVCHGRTFATATRADGRALAEHLFDEEELKSHTVRKMVGHLRAAVNVALDNPDQFPAIKSNPFSGVVTDRPDEMQRKMFDDADMAAIRADLDNWAEDERLLWALCATTGMRRGEAWHITSEERIGGRRVVHIGSKTPSSDRRIPLPSGALPYLPSRITGPLFDFDSKSVGKRVLRRIRAIGITDPAKVLHSTRHRASTRLHGVQDSVRDAILGHDDAGRGGKKRASARYFGGHPIETIAEAIERIGF